MKTIQLFFVIIITAFVFSCAKSSDEPAPPPNLGIRTYQKEVRTLMSNSCISCHSSTAPVAQRQQPYLETFDQVKAATQAPGKLICRMEVTCGNVMPPSGKLPVATIAIMKDWASQGYNN
jgi:hypothetical protein